MQEQTALQVYQKLTTMENRIVKLEKIIAGQNDVIQSLLGKNTEMPNHSLLASSFLVRAFSVWGHYFVAQLIIGAVLGLLFFCGTLIRVF